MQEKINTAGHLYDLGLLVPGGAAASLMSILNDSPILGAIIIFLTLALFVIRVLNGYAKWRINKSRAQINNEELRKAKHENDLIEQEEG